MSLDEIIIEKINMEGPVSFRDFMEMALYHPGAGYYTSMGDRIGMNGDFYTSPYFTSLFGELLAKQLEEMWEKLDRQPFTIVEYGAGTGFLCRDILGHLAKNPRLYEGLRYCIIEKSPAMREKERAILPEKVSWHDCIGDIRPFSGCVLSNEVVDNFSVHRVVMEEELMEVFVDHRQGEFTELLCPAPGPLKDYLQQLGVTLPKGFRTEINLDATGWIQEIGNALERGFVLTIDYGHPSSVLYSDQRQSGTMVCYHKHRMNDNPYCHIGLQDITAHVNFSALKHWGLQNGLRQEGYTSQAFFLQALGLANHLKRMEAGGGQKPMEAAMWMHTFMMDIGRKFKVLMQQKGMTSSPLSGFTFTQPLA